MKSVLADVNFSDKIGLKGISTKVCAHQVFDHLTWNGCGDKESWTIAEWASRYLMKDGRKEKPLEGGGLCFSNAGKSVCLYPGQGKISLACDTAAEYDHARASGEDWIHLLIEQRIDGKDRVYLSEMKELFLTLDFSIDYCENCMKAEEYNPMLHAAQISWFFTVEFNRGRKFDFEGRPDYLWFGLPLFDSRYSVMAPPQPFFDKGTEKVIYSLKRGDYLQEPFEIGKKYCISLDILPGIREAFRLAKEQDWLKGAGWEDMTIGSTNLGWEVPGTFRCKATFENLSLTYTQK